jgi:hypothetical protein
VVSLDLDLDLDLDLALELELELGAADRGAARTIGNPSVVRR